MKAMPAAANTMPVVKARTQGVGSTTLEISMPNRGVAVAGTRVGASVAVGSTPMTTGVATTIAVGV